MSLVGLTEPCYFQKVGLEFVHSILEDGDVLNLLTPHSSLPLACTPHLPPFQMYLALVLRQTVLLV